MIVGIVGTLGAGKGTIVEYLKTKGFAHYSASGYLKDTLLARGIEPNRDTYSKLAGEIRGKDKAGLAKLLFEQSAVDGVSRAIIESLHDVGEAMYIQKVGGVLLAIDADMEIRYERAIKRGSEKDNVTFDKFKSEIEREEHGGGPHNIRKALELANYTIMNNGTKEELEAAVDAWLRSLT